MTDAIKGTAVLRVRVTVEFDASGPWGLGDTLETMVRIGKREGMQTLHGRLTGVGMKVIGEPEVLAYVYPEKQPGQR